jgi:TolB-like protein
LEIFVVYSAMNKLLFTLLLLALATYGQQERIAIIQTLDNNDSLKFNDLAYLTDKLRETAVNVLPKEQYGVMTTESIIAFLGSQEQARKACNESSCLAELGRKVSADYVAQGRIGRFGNDLTIRVELYSVKSGNLIGSFTGDAKDIYGLRDIINEKATDLFKKISNASNVKEPVPPSLPQSALVAELPKPMSVAQALSSTNLPKGCSEDFTNLLGKDGFDMAKFMKELPQDVAKVKLQLKSPFGKPKDSDKTNSGLTVGCVKALPESPAEITSLLKDIGLKIGLNLAVDAAASVVAHKSEVSNADIQELIKKDLFENRVKIQKASFPLSTSDKVALYEGNKKEALIYAGLNVLPGFGVGSYMQGNIAAGVLLSIYGVAGWSSLLVLGYDREIYDDDGQKKDGVAIRNSIMLSFIVCHYVCGAMGPFLYKYAYNKTLKEALNIDNEISFSIDPLIIPKDRTPAVGLAFNVRY